MNVKAEREAARISQAELSRRTGILQPKLSKIENGHIEATSGEEALIRAALHETVATESSDLEAWETEALPALHCYPAAPKDVIKRRAWMTRRNRNMQERGVPAPASGTYGAAPKKPKA